MASLVFKAKRTIKRAQLIVKKEIWEFSNVHDKSIKGKMMALLRIISIMTNGVFENKLFSKAASLSYSSLLGMGPMIGIIILLAGAFVQGNPEDYIKKSLFIIAPTLNTQTDDGESIAEDDMSLALDSLITQISEGAKSSMAQIDNSKQGLYSIVGLLTVIFVGIQLLTTIETTMNSIWGIRKGRSWIQRIVFYWTFISLGSFLGLGALSIFSIASLPINLGLLPFQEAFKMIAAPCLSFLMLTCLLTLFYQFFPNTSVRLKPAMSGASIVSLVLLSYNGLSFLYLGHVVRAKDFYGPMALVVLILFGLYLSWSLILIGAQVTYSVQNVDYLTNQQSWNNISLRTRETLTLSTLLVISRKFHECKPAIDVAELGDIIRVPGNILNQSINQLCKIGYITTIVVENKEGLKKNTYQPARPLSKIKLNEFRKAYFSEGNIDNYKFITDADPLVKYYRTKSDQYEKDIESEKSLEELFSELS